MKERTIFAIALFLQACVRRSLSPTTSTLSPLPHNHHAHALCALRSLRVRPHAEMRLGPEEGYDERTLMRGSPGPLELYERYRHVSGARKQRHNLSRLWCNRQGRRQGPVHRDGQGILPKDMRGVRGLCQPLRVHGGVHA